MRCVEVKAAVSLLSKYHIASDVAYAIGFYPEQERHQRLRRSSVRKQHRFHPRGAHLLSSVFHVDPHGRRHPRVAEGGSVQYGDPERLDRRVATRESP